MAVATRRGVATTRTSDAVRADVTAQWRMRCTALEERLQDATRAHSDLQEQHGELSLDYRHALNQLWKINAGMSTRRGR
jgi:hypothetical protein